MEQTTRVQYQCQSPRKLLFNIVKKLLIIVIVSSIFDNILYRDISTRQKVEFECPDQNWQNRQLGLLVLEQRNFVTFHRGKL